MPSESANQLGIRVSSMEERLRASLSEISTSKRAASQNDYVRGQKLEEDAKKLEEHKGKAREAHEARFEKAREDLKKESQRRMRRLWQAHDRVRARIAHERQMLTDRGQNELKQAEEGIVAEEGKVLSRIQEEHNAFLAEIAALREKGNALKSRVVRLASSVGAAMSNDAGAESPAEPDDPKAALDALGERLTAMAVACVDLETGFWTSWSRRTRAILTVILLAAIHGGVLALMIQKGQPFKAYLYLGGSALGTMLPWLLITSLVRGRAGTRLQGLYQEGLDVLAKLVEHEKKEKERFWAASEKLVEQRLAALAKVNEKIQARDSGKAKAIEDRMADCKDRHQRLKDRVQAWTDQARENLEKLHATESKRLEADLAAAEQKLHADAEASARQAAKALEDSTARASSEWKNALSGFLGFAKETTANSLARQHAWAQVQHQPLPKDFPHDIRIGTLQLPLRSLDVPLDDQYRVPEATVELPLALTFPSAGSLVVQAGGTHREQALEMLFNTTLRVLASFPPNMAKLTILDPVGLGQAYSALMQLADYDDSLIGGKIWTDAGHIEKRLSEKTEHIEGVIQNYLRNRYATLSDYNRDAGEMKEAHHFLLIADFPSGMSDLALERLASIVNSGPRCGVHVLMYHDTRQKWPEVVDLQQVRRNGVVIKATNEGFVAAHDGLYTARFQPERVPAMPDVDRFLERFGKSAIEAKRVELSFATVAPKPEEIWTRSSESTLRVPIGRSGAVRIQELELGKGTAQHALIAGRTGSGKSTLFHAMITNTALWYSPKEVEFYMIDFKKGVEFKAYGTHGLPHARVIAVESDREFGLSVLKRLDKELDRRGELFRQAGVQDLANFRKSGPSEHLPRTLLLVDEFQEFFTEDDGVAQEAALLLDRFVRQGRAFGLHIILGSQTLSGVYTLAKSTLGQMGVRIALQCNESDSYLILSEDNAAARLLSRPGEAIYNDMSGLVEGNVPFQIVWLSGEQEAEYLQTISRKAKETKLKTGFSPVVFEGNAPANLEQNTLLAAALEDKAPSEKSALAVWLGEPNAIKHPTEAHFTDAGGSHLLMIGQRKDAVLGMSTSMILSLAARLSPDQLRILLLDGSGADEEFTQHLQRLAESLPHDISVVAHRDLPETIAGLDAQMSAEPGADGDSERRTFLFVLGLHRFKALRQEDEFSMSSRDEGASTGERFANILREGPEHRIHAVVWCDTLANTNRALTRRTMREFDQRVLFQMSAADSSELIDSPAANKLGLHSALLFVESDGILEKFRPYALPPEAWLQTVGATLQARTSQRA
ncbi:MAG: ATP-binding protein [Planctomycetota bacterium]|nr:ATP-binding protein [Planctomycetota bacterium]